MSIVEKIKKIEKLYHATGCSETQITDAENALGIKFPEEYVAYIKAYGAISFYATEWTGLNVEGYLNVVDVTKQEQDLNPSFPKNCFVLENQGIDGIQTVMNEDGQVFTVQYEKTQLLCDSLSDYLDMCIARKK